MHASLGIRNKGRLPRRCFREDCSCSPWRPDQHEILSVSAVIEQNLEWPALHSVSTRVRHVANGECSEKSEMPPILRSVPHSQCGQEFYFGVAYNTVHMERVQGKHHLSDDQDPSSLLFHAMISHTIDSLQKRSEDQQRSGEVKRKEHQRQRQDSGRDSRRKGGNRLG